MKKITIRDIRNIKHLDFEIPSPGLYIVTGKNGTGKTTLFTSISRICNNNAYRLGFPSTKLNDYDMFSGTITYTVDNNTTIYSRRSNGEWRPNNQLSTLNDFGFPAIINITTKNERVFSQQDINPRRRKNPDERLNQKLNEVFNTNKFTNMTRITTGDLRRGRSNLSATDRRRNIAFVIPLSDNKYYTEQNFSFGEIVMLNLLLDVKNAVNGSLLLIDELELALHPSAQIKLISILQDLALQKGLTIIISTHSSSIIKSQKSVILLEQDNTGNVTTIYDCPPAKAIGAIGMREDTMPDIIVLVEDKMAKALFYALLQKNNELNQHNNFLDIRILEIGGFTNVVNFYNEAINYVFYDNVYVTAYMDKDVETDIIPYSNFGNQEVVRIYEEHSLYLRFLPYTPEVLLAKALTNYKNFIINHMRIVYNNQQIQYNIGKLDFSSYDTPFPYFNNQNEYNAFIEQRGRFRKLCKEETEEIAKSLASQINSSLDEIYRLIFKVAIDQLCDTELNIRELLAPTINRITRR